MEAGIERHRGRTGQGSSTCGLCDAANGNAIEVVFPGINGHEKGVQWSTCHGAQRAASGSTHGGREVWNRSFPDQIGHNY
jgi:hypothetical protein